MLIDTESRTRTELSPDTQAILLLCSNLSASGEPSPLTTAQYNRVDAGSPTIIFGRATCWRRKPSRT